MEMVFIRIINIKLKKYTKIVVFNLIYIGILIEVNKIFI